MKRITLALFIALFSLAVPAQDPDKESASWYEVEIIIFENLSPGNMESEQWPLDVGQPDLNNAIQLRRLPADNVATDLTETNLDAAPMFDPPQTGVIANDQYPGTGDARDPYLDTPYLILPATQYRLANAYQKLIDSDDYLPLLHVAWRQIIPPREQPDHIFIDDKLNDVVQEPLDQAHMNGTEPPGDLDIPPPVDLQPDIATEDNIADDKTPEHTLSGIISLGLGRYLHVDADLLLYKPQPDNTAVDTAPTLYSQLEAAPFVFKSELEPVTEEKQTPELFRIQGNMSMRSKEVHYLDHPLLGMLILFTPYKPPEPKVIEKIKEPATAAAPPEKKDTKGVIILPGREKEDRSF